jgi:superfamily II DNA or RNA helicase
MQIRLDGWAWAPRAEFTSEQLETLRQHLTVTLSGDDAAAKTIKLYRELPDWFGMPREYYLPKRKSHHVIDDHTTAGNMRGWPGTLKFNPSRTLKPEQAEALDMTKRYFALGPRGGLVRAAPGWGKCLALGTPVLRFDGSLVPVEEIREGDLLMGPDSQPRHVLSTTRGRGPMYRIVPRIGRPWVCNDAHILTLVHSVTNEVRDIELQDWLRLPAWKKHHLKQFSPAEGVTFPKGPALPIDPYFLGVWFGDGTKRLSKVAITTKDAEIEQLCRDVAAQYGLRVRREDPTHLDNPCPTYHIVGSQGHANELLDVLRAVVGDGEHLPAAYLCASREDRLKFLAGLIDTDGFHNNGCYELVQKRREWAEDVAFLARSLGIRATVKPKQVAGATYWLVKMAGDFEAVPMRIPRKVPRKRLQKKTATRTSFEVESIGEGDYAGFTLEGDGRFLLGDFTVTHNTVYTCAVIAEVNAPTLVIVHKEFLKNQWRERLEEYLPGIKIGEAQGDTCDYEGKHVVLGMVHSLSGRQYDRAFYQHFGLIVSDEVHRIGAYEWSSVPGRFPARHRLGITATPRRKDGAENVFRYHVGQEIFAAKQESLPFKARFLYSEFYLVKTTSYNGTAGRSVAINYLIQNETRNRLIAHDMAKALVAGRKLLVVSERLEHLKLMDAALRETLTAAAAAIPSIGYFVGGKSEEQLAKASTCQVIFATTQLVLEGLDIPALDTLFLTTPLTDIEQAIGRIRRPSEGKKAPVVVDVRDDRVPMCRSSATARLGYYKRMNALDTST